MRIIDTYIITYSNGCQQTLDLISHDDFINDIKVKFKEIMDLETLSDKPLSKTVLSKISDLKSYIKKEYGDRYFTTQSPLYLSQFNNNIMVLPPHQGGEHYVKLIKL